MEYNMENNVEFLDDETTCRICYAEFLDTTDLNQHITQIHLNESTINRYCCVCRSFFQNVEEYALHLRTYHLKCARWCKYCTRVFFNKDDLKKHEKKHGEWKYKSCSQCEKTFLFKDILAAHEYKYHRNYKDISEGIMLEESFPVLSSLLHMNVKKFFTVQYTHESYMCVSCGLTTSNMDKFLRHVETESKKPFVCNLCCQVFVSKYKLRKHMSGKCNRSVEWAECGTCEKRIDSMSFKAHTKQCVRRKYELSDKDATTSKTIPILTCKFCKKMFVGNIALDKHIDRAHKPNFHLYKYKCITCDIPFHHPKYLFTHYFTQHRDMQPYTCKICDKKFKVRRTFTLHIKLDHKSVGFVEFDENYKVFFTDKKSEKPFQPYPVLPEYLENKQIVKNNKIEDSKIQLTMENSDFINAFETECDTDVDRREENVSKSVEIVEGETECETDIDKAEENVSKPFQTEDDETECETDVDRREQNVSKPAETVEEETECETDVDKKTENLNVKTAAYVEVEIDCESNYEKDKAILKRRRPVNNGSETDVDMTRKKVKTKRKSRAMKTRNKSKQNYNTEISSNDSDVPLIEMTKRDLDLGKNRRKNKFVCLKCNKNCYTYQNYNHHMSLHVGYKVKKCIKCIKCQKKFKSKIALDEHMKKKHTSSKLTDTLKQVLERRKNGVQGTSDPKTIHENFKKTVYKVNIPEDESAPAVLKLVEDGLSAKSFIESFMPEDSTKDIRVTSSITIKEIRGGYRSPLIKMTKFKPESTTNSTKLRMPVKFKPENTSHVKAKMKIVQKPVVNTHKPQLALSSAPDENHDCTYQPYDTDHVFIDDREEVPEVAEEVMLNMEEKDEIKEPKIMDTQNNIVIPNIPENYGDIKIAHLQSEAPFYKIVSMKDVMKTALPKSQIPAQSLGPVTVPGGMKLVSVNPLAHLLGNTDVEKILKPNKHYLAKAGDIKSAMEKAMKNVYQPKRRRKIV